MSSLILASASPRRKELLEQIGLEFKTASMDIDETVNEGEQASHYVQRLAEEKARAGLLAFPEQIILAADTTVVIEGSILGKPESNEDAFSMLTRLSGTTHEVLTGVAVAANMNGQLKLLSEVVTTKVFFASLTRAEMTAYIETGEPMGKAGAYGIQGKAALFVDRLEGSYSNVVGLPLAETARLLVKIGYSVW